MPRRAARAGAVSIFLIGSLIALAPAHAAPANDNLANAFDIPVLPYDTTGDLTDASREFSEPEWCSPLPSIWYKITLAVDQTVVLRTTEGDPYLGIYTGPGYKELYAQGCGVPYKGSRVAWRALAGRTYYLQIAGTGGQINLHIESPPPPPNDHRANAISIPYSPDAPVSRSIVESAGATAEPDEPKPSCAYTITGIPTVWYTMQTPADASGFLELDRIGGSNHAAVYRLMPDATLTQIACADSRPALLQVAPSATYYFQLADLSGLYFHQTGENGIMAMNLAPPVPGDLFSQAKTITSLPYRDSFDGRRLTAEVGERRASCEQSTYNTGSMWYRYTAPEDQVVKLDAISGNSNTLGVFSGSSLADLSELTCRRSWWSSGHQYLHVEMRAGESIWIQSIPGSSVNVDFDMDISPAPANDDRSAPTEVLTAPLFATSASSVSSGARLSPGEQAAPCGDNDQGSAVWFKTSFQLPEPRRISTQSSSYDTVLAVYDAATGGLVACNNDASATTKYSAVAFTPVPLKEYLIEVTGQKRSNGELRLSFQWPPTPPSQPPPPANDNFDDGHPIASLPFADVGDTTGATMQPNERQPSTDCINTATDNYVAHSIWYSYTPTVDEVLQMSVAANTLNTIVAAYTGDTVVNLTQVACTGSVSVSGQAARVQVAQFQASAGVTYHFQVSRRGTSNTGPAPFQLISMGQV